MVNSTEKIIIEKLKQNLPFKDKKNSIIYLKNSQGIIKESLEYNKISPLLRGLIFERYVGLYYESKGYSVIYRGIDNGVLDEGIDLICEKKNKETCFIQCKSGDKNIGKQSIELILFKGGLFFKKRLEKKVILF